MAFQQPISLKCNQQMVGQKLDVLVDGAGDGVSIDGYVVVEKELPINQMTPVLITGAMEYDLVAVPVDESILVM